MKRSDHLNMMWNWERGGALAAFGFLSFLILSCMAGTAHASATIASATISPNTCAAVQTTDANNIYQACPAITSNAPYNSAESNAGQTLGPIDPFGPSSGSATQDQCHYIFNASTGASSTSIFVPFNKVQEWQNFYKNANTGYAKSGITVVVDTCARPLLPGNASATPGAATVVPPCCSAGGASSTVTACTLDPASPAVSYFAQPVSTNSNGVAGYSSTHTNASKSVLNTGVATTGVAGSGKTGPYANVSATTGAITKPVAMSFLCDAPGGGTVVQTAVQALYTAGDSTSSLNSWTLSSVTYTTASASCGSANNVPSKTAPTTGLCPSGETLQPPGVVGTGPYTWYCYNTTSPTAVSPQCSAPAVGQCGTAVSSVWPSAPPTATLCLAGDTPTTPTSDPATATWKWNCTGPGTGGTTVPCSAQECMSWNW